MSSAIVFIPGLFHQGKTFDDIRSVLAPEYETVAESLPDITRKDVSNVTLHDDISFVREKMLLPLIEDEGKDVFVVLHSCGGISGSAAVEGLSKKERNKAGKDGGIVGMIYLTGVLLPEGEMNAGYWDKVASDNNIADMLSIADDTTWYTTPEAAKTYFYNDMPSSEAEEKWIPLLRNCAPGFSFTPVPYTAWSKPEFKDICTFVEVIGDNTIPVNMQRKMMEIAGMTSSASIEGGHCVYLSKPKETAKVLLQVIDKLKNDVS